ncbi:MAG: 50S ribosomal protein L13 [Oscillospiraceae bacterium]|nr:50S ribosomal protein L13 [Oscillospiraceae bacterium]
MSTFMANPQNVERKWYVLDAEGKSLGRVAAAAASILNGKNKPTYTPHVDCGDFVIIINADKAVLTGNKLNSKVYRWHTGWIGHLKEYKYSDMMVKEPEKAMTLAVEGMLPHNSIGKNSAKRLRVYKGAEHPHAAQMPVAVEF